MTETNMTLSHCYVCYFSLKANNKVSLTWTRWVTATEKFLEGLYLTFNLVI